MTSDHSAVLGAVPDNLFIAGQGGHLPRVQLSTSTTLPPARSSRPSPTRPRLTAWWAGVPARGRGELLRRAFDMLQERKEEFAHSLP